MCSGEVFVLVLINTVHCSVTLLIILVSDCILLYVV